jgi:pimeloyl-ACP methyl ester carboxylesterase
VLVGFAALLLLAAPQDTLLDVGGYRMHVVVHRGTRPLTIVMEAGGGSGAESWAGVDSLLAARSGATVVAYDRAGFGRSGTGPASLTPRDEIRRLDQALERLGTPKDRIVVGHSYGALFALLHAHLYSEKVRGVALVDPMNPRFVQATGDFVYTTVPHIERPATAKDSAVARMVSTFGALARDPDAADSSLRIPMAVVTAGEQWWGKPAIDSAWRASHEAIARAEPRRNLTVAGGAHHDIPEENPGAIVQAVMSVVYATGDWR